MLAAATSVTLAAGGFAALGAAPAAAAPGGAAAASTQAVRSVLTRAGTSTPGALAHASTAAGKPRQIRMLPRPSSGASPHVGAVPSAAASNIASAPLGVAFDGIQAEQSANVNGFDVEPPDEGLGAGNGYVVNLVNLAGAVYNTHGRMLTNVFSLNNFFVEPSSVNLSDPRAYYDSSTHTWFATVLEYQFGNSGVSESHVDIAVNPSGNPRRTWTVYRLDTTNPIHHGCPCLADYPIFGIDGYNIYVSTNEFTQGLNNFNGSQLYAISKSQLVALSNSVNYVLFPNLSIAGTLAYHLQPAVTTGRSPAEYLMNSLDPNNTYDNRLGVWALTNRASVTSGRGMPVLTNTVIGSEAYAMPPNAVTPPGYDSGLGEVTTGIVASDFDAMQEVQYIRGHLVGALNTAVNIPGDSSSRAGNAWFDVRPSVSGTGVSGHVTRQGYVVAHGRYLLYPHVNMTPSGAMAMTFSVGGPGTYLSAAYATMPAGANRFAGIRLAGAGVAPDNGFTATNPYGGVGRWGDYSAGEIEPGTGRVWLATQYIPNQGDQYANWGNRIFSVTP